MELSPVEQVTRELKLRAYSVKTIKAYSSCLRGYIDYCGGDIRRFNPEKVRSFFMEKHTAGLAPQTINLYLNAIKFYYRNIIEYKGPIGIRFAKRSRRLPVVLSRDEIKKMIGLTKYGQHKLLLALSYGAGLRVSEVIKLKYSDIDFPSKLILVREGKGKKDRLVLLPQNLIAYIQQHTHKGSYLFMGATWEEHLCARSAQYIFKNAAKRAGIRDDASFHSLRHSFATHMLEDGVDIRFIQDLMGHRDIRTTQIYTSVMKSSLVRITSPLDRIRIAD
ncbi:integrase [Candidatus Peregrinibacteria bacterium CG11_big_fil_rev_8_21_14_0_20_41_10]|nr:MAG: integrase [Candidatus Peregrinibacteria bacterium CG11_big_fil_rev_8_21_14_0_20_41_10]PIZ77418.1 MAG: integrase [Candidatus Peregrinibacteria bacterium CG_4_10_14_0_2_um_filter_41_8]PJC38362.1 MAG: integrase [Candidatus Peregrinibacteria bacterium CG_4_9_14_0_2_um_filter_41_14]